MADAPAPIFAASKPPKLIRCIDLEPCGMEAGDPIVEVGWCDVVLSGLDPTMPVSPDDFDTIQLGNPKSELANPERKIPPQAMGVHHITDRMVAKARNASWILRELMDVDVLCAHNIEMERAYFDVGGMPWLCTYKTALRLWPEAPDHKQQTLRYWLDLELDEKLAMPAHRAGPDAYVCSRLVERLLREQPLEWLCRISEGPALLVKCWFKKHRGELWKDIAETDISYLTWVSKNIDDDRDAVATAKYWLKKHFQKANAGKARGPAQAAEPEQPDEPIETITPAEPERTLV